MIVILVLIDLIAGIIICIMGYKKKDRILKRLAFILFAIVVIKMVAIYYALETM